MAIWRILLATALLLTVLSCNSSDNTTQLVEAPSPATMIENFKFMTRSEPVIGIRDIDLDEILGPPMEIKKGECTAPLSMSEEDPEFFVVGDTWVYFHETASAHISLALCVADEHVVSEARVEGYMNGSKVLMSTHFLIDTDLTKKAFRGELSTGSYGPGIKYEGPRIEI